MKNIRIALLACLVGLFAVACEKEQDESAPEISTNIFKLNFEPFVENNGTKVWLQYGDPSKLFYEDGDKIRITSNHGISRDFVIKYRTTSDGQSPAVTEDGWYAQGTDTLGGNLFYAAFVDGYKDYNANLSGNGPSYSFNINSVKERSNYNKVILAGCTSTNEGNTVITLKPACAILRLNTGGASMNYVKVGFEATKVPKTGTLNASTHTISVGGASDYLTGVTSGGAGEFLYMRESNQDAGEDRYYYVAIPIVGSSVNTTLYLEWNNGSGATQYKTSGQVTLEKGRVYTVGTTRSTPFTADGYTRSFFYVNGSGNFVAFSAGNLQGQRYIQGLSQRNIWQFAPSQVYSLKSDNASIGLGVWVDLLGYGTSGNGNKHPNMSSTTASDYTSGDIAGTNFDWGVNNYASPGIIYGASTITDVPWSTLTKTEWEYLVGRSNKAGLATVTIDARSYTGMILLPDLTESGTPWSMPEGVSFTAGFSSYTLNNYNSSQWSTLENAGAVFLPVTYKRNGTTVDGANEGYYWTTTGNAGSPGNKSWAMKIAAGSVTFVPTPRPQGCAVRLVARAESKK